MSPPVTYLPVYLGLFAALVLAVACNAYLDIRYGSFGTEIVLWSGAFASTLWIAWRQRGKVNASGLFWQKLVLIVGLLLSLLVFTRIWGMPRAGVYVLAALQAAANCVTVDRRKFLMALLASVVMVMFAAGNFRADWTMIFYLFPYLVAVVYTLVAEQVSRRLQEVRQDGLGRHVAGGQGLSIVAATAILLVVAVVLFVVTPQPVRPYLDWRFGQPGIIGGSGATEKGADGGTLEQGGSGVASEEELAAGAGGHGGPGDQDFASGEAGQSVGDGYRESIDRAPFWPTVWEMREAARRPGMPAWQAAVIERIAASAERVEISLQSLHEQLRAVQQRAAKWLAENRQDVLRGVILLILLALLGAAYRLLREARAGLWLRTQVDFLRFGVLGLHASGNVAARQYFGAMERLFAVHDVEREAWLNTREYLARLQRLHDSLRDETAEMIALFEKARYSKATLGSDEIARMRHLYRRMHASV